MGCELGWYNHKNDKRRIRLVFQDSCTSNNLYSIHFTDNQTGWAVGEYGTILVTTNGGLDWSSQSSGAVRIYIRSISQIIKLAGLWEMVAQY